MATRARGRGTEGGGGVAVGGGSVFPLVDVNVAQLEGRALRQRHLAVVEEGPLAVLLDVADVVAARRVRAHVRDEPQQLVRAAAVVERHLRRGAATAAAAAAGVAAVVARCGRWLLWRRVALVHEIGQVDGRLLVVRVGDATQLDALRLEVVDQLRWPVDAIVRQVELERRRWLLCILEPIALPVRILDQLGRARLADRIAREEQLRDEVVGGERRVVFDEPRELVDRGRVVELVVGEVDEGRVAALRARKLDDVADARAREVVACHEWGMARDEGMELSDRRAAGYT
mmetsp:Transcript_6362/g.16783  ORF Transcript_6362/g.16783 Transcript_6362/m.16783 type:complete len:288 (+) Transcript_6362:376-1239(+)